jgi:carbon monoxide dehydrogenase subunit G
MKKLTFKVQKDVNTVKDYLSDAEKFVSVHPLIYKMKHLGENKYKVFEKIDIGNIPYRFTYMAYFTIDENSVRIDAQVMGLTKIAIHFSFSEKGGYTQITENLEINSILPIKSFMYSLFEKQHQIMFNTIEKA